MATLPRRPRGTVPPVSFDWSFWLIIGIVVLWLSYNYWNTHRKEDANRAGTGQANPTIPGGQVWQELPDSTSYLLKVPGIGYPAPVLGEQIIRHRAYTLSYNEDAEQASWVAYTLSSENFKGQINRKEQHEQFVSDGEVETQSATPQDYAHSGYDRGHLAPAGDMKFDEQTYAESFLMSNMSPQRPGLNRELWRRIEEKVRRWQRRDKYLFVVSGPVLRKGLPTIGPDQVAVPEEYYKVVLDLSAPDIKMIGFLTPNANSKLSVEKFVVSVDKIERETGLDFFPQLPDELEDRLERDVATRRWFAN